MIWHGCYNLSLLRALYCYCFLLFLEFEEYISKKMDILNITSTEVWRNNYKKKEKNMKKIYSQKGELMFYKSL